MAELGQPVFTRTVIMGHGLRNGKGGTYRPGQVVPPAVAEALGDGVAGVSGPAPAPTPEAPMQAPAPVESIPTQPPVGQPVQVVPPDSRRALSHMKREDVEALAVQHEIVVGEDVKGRMTVMRDLLAAKLGLQ